MEYKPGTTLGPVHAPSHFILPVWDYHYTPDRETEAYRGHPASKWESQNLNPGLSDMKAIHR